MRVDNTSTHCFALESYDTPQKKSSRQVRYDKKFGNPEALRKIRNSDNSIRSPSNGSDMKA